MREWPNCMRMQKCPDWVTGFSIELQCGSSETCTISRGVLPLQIRGSRSEIALFYRTSWEFIRSLRAGHGRHNLIATVDDVAGGTSFEVSLTENSCGHALA